SLPERWAVAPLVVPQVQIKIKINDAERPGECQLGRFGIFLAHDLHPALPGLLCGERVSLHIKTGREDIPVIRGVAELVWDRFDTEGELQAGCGLVFTYVDESCRNQLIR